jgi:hypothetical protein
MKAKHALIHDIFTLERRYPSAPDKVYRYFSEPTYRKRWFGAPADWSQRSHSLAFRVGGQELEQGAPPDGPLITYDSRILEFLPDGTRTFMRLTEHGAYFDGNPEGPRLRVHGIGKQLDLLGQVLQKDQH